MQRLILLIGLLLISGCSPKEQSLQQFIEDAKVAPVEKIVIVSGSTGASKSVTDEDLIVDFLNDVEQVVFTRDENQEMRDGFRYAVTFEGNGNAFHFSPTMINDTYYTTSPDLHLLLDEFYSSIQ